MQLRLGIYMGFTTSVKTPSERRNAISGPQHTPCIQRAFLTIADTTCSSHLNATSVVCDWFRSCSGHFLSAELLRKWRNRGMLLLPRYDKPHLTRKKHYMEVSCRMDQHGQNAANQVDNAGIDTRHVVVKTTCFLLLLRR